MKISKKNQELADWLSPASDSFEIAQELQKRDDKIKALRAEVKALTTGAVAYQDEGGGLTYHNCEFRRIGRCENDE